MCIRDRMSIGGNTDFSAVRFNDAAPIHTFNRTFTVSNTGDQTLTVTDVSVTGDFAVTGAPANGAQSFTVMGVGTNAVIAVSDPAFGIVNIGNSANQDITVTNNGGAPKG